MQKNTSIKNYKVENKGYGDAGASVTKRTLKAFKASSGSPKEDIDYYNYTMRQRSRMLYMAAPIAASAIKTSRTNAIGIGLQLSPKVDAEVLGISPQQAERWEKNTKREFALWAETAAACDALALNNFYELQQLAFISWLMSGDVFVVRKDYGPEPLRPYGLRLHLVEADRVSTPSAASANIGIQYTEGKAENGNLIHDGVEVNDQGRIMAYHICNVYPFSLIAADEPAKWTRVEARGEKTGLPNVLHIMNSERPDQYRGVSYLSQIIEPILQLRRYTEAEIDAAVVQSFFTAFIKTETDTSEMPFNETGEPDAEEASYDPNEYEMGPGQINVMNPNESVEFGAPTHPNTGFDEFVKAICLQIGAALEIPRELLMKEFNASYSASRAALLEAWKAFRMYREWFVTDFCNPVYKIWLTEAVARGRVQAPGYFTDPAVQAAWLKAEWIGPSPGQLDPVKEIQAEILAVQNGFSTHEESTIKLNGGSWSDNIDKLRRENEIKQEAIPQEGGNDAKDTDYQRGGQDQDTVTKAIYH